MKQTTMDRLEDLFARSPLLLAGGPVADDEISLAEANLGLAFDVDYRWFVKRYAGAMVGSLPVYGLRTSDVMGDDDTVINATRRLRDDGMLGTKDWLVISNDGFGNAIVMANDGRVLLLDHETGGVVDLAESFEAFLLALLDERLIG